jgi:mRNA interferase MazF
LAGLCNAPGPQGRAKYDCRTVLVLPLSSSGIPRPPLAIEVECLGRNVVAVCDQLRAIDKSRLHQKAGSLKPGDLERIEDGLRQILSL